MATVGVKGFNTFSDRLFSDRNDC